MFPAEKILAEALKKREEQGSLRKLSLIDKRIDFCSNDYLGFARSEELQRMVEEKMSTLRSRSGSGGSRLLSGNSVEAEKLESELAIIHKTPAALLFNSGYDANMGLFSCMAKKGDTILYDELVHASIHDGMRLSRADSFPFLHNDMGHLQERIKTAKGTIFVAVESVYSMDGDFAPLKEIVTLCIKYGVNLIVDEAHATGVFGYGLVQNFNLEDKVFARVHTFGKALGCHGAAVLGTQILKNYLINFARSFIYTTALPLHSIITIGCSYELLEKIDTVVKNLQENISYFREKIQSGAGWLDSISPIQSLIVPGNLNVKRLAGKLQEQDMDVRPILSPTVPKDTERIRVCLHSYNTKEEIDLLLDTIKKGEIK